MSSEVYLRLFFICFQCLYQTHAYKILLFGPNENDQVNSHFMSIFKLGSWLAGENHQVYMLTTDRMVEALKGKNVLEGNITMLASRTLNFDKRRGNKTQC